MDLPTDGSWKCLKCSRGKIPLKKEASIILRDALTTYTNLCTDKYVDAVTSAVCILSDSDTPNPQNPVTSTKSPATTQPSSTDNTVVVRLANNDTDDDIDVNHQIRPNIIPKLAKKPSKPLKLHSNIVQPTNSNNSGPLINSFVLPHSTVKVEYHHPSSADPDNEKPLSEIISHDAPRRPRLQRAAKNKSATPIHSPKMKVKAKEKRLREARTEKHRSRSGSKALREVKSTAGRRRTKKNSFKRKALHPVDDIDQSEPNVPEPSNLGNEKNMDVNVEQLESSATPPSQQNISSVKLEDRQLPAPNVSGNDITNDRNGATHPSDFHPGTEGYCGDVEDDVPLSKLSAEYAKKSTSALDQSKDDNDSDEIRPNVSVKPMACRDAGANNPSVRESEKTLSPAISVQVPHGVGVQLGALKKEDMRGRDGLSNASLQITKSGAGVNPSASQRWANAKLDPKREALLTFAMGQKLQPKPGDSSGKLNSSFDNEGPNRSSKMISRIENVPESERQRIQVTALAASSRRRLASNVLKSDMQGMPSSKGSINDLLQPNSPVGYNLPNLSIRGQLDKASLSNQSKGYGTMDGKMSNNISERGSRLDNNGSLSRRNSVHGEPLSAHIIHPKPPAPLQKAAILNVVHQPFPASARDTCGLDPISHSVAPKNEDGEVVFVQENHVKRVISNRQESSLFQNKQAKISSLGSVHLARDNIRRPEEIGQGHGENVMPSSLIHSQRELLVRPGNLNQGSILSSASHQQEACREKWQSRISEPPSLAERRKRLTRHPSNIHKLEPESGAKARHLNLHSSTAMEPVPKYAQFNRYSNDSEFVQSSGPRNTQNSGNSIIDGHFHSRSRYEPEVAMPGANGRTYGVPDAHQGSLPPTTFGGTTDMLSSRSPPWTHDVERESESRSREIEVERIGRVQDEVYSTHGGNDVFDIVDHTVHSSSDGRARRLMQYVPTATRRAQFEQGRALAFNDPSQARHSYEHIEERRFDDVVSRQGVESSFMARSHDSFPYDYQRQHSDYVASRPQRHESFNQKREDHKNGGARMSHGGFESDGGRNVSRGSFMSSMPDTNRGSVSLSAPVESRAMRSGMGAPMEPPVEPPIGPVVDRSMPPPPMGPLLDARIRPLSHAGEFPSNDRERSRIPVASVSRVEMSRNMPLHFPMRDSRGSNVTIPQEGRQRRLRNEYASDSGNSAITGGTGQAMGVAVHPPPLHPPMHGTGTRPMGSGTGVMSNRLKSRPRGRAGMSSFPMSSSLGEPIIVEPMERGLNAARGRGVLYSHRQDEGVQMQSYRSGREAVGEERVSNMPLVARFDSASVMYDRNSAGSRSLIIGERGRNMVDVPAKAEEEEERLPSLRSNAALKHLLS